MHDHEPGLWVGHSGLRTGADLAAGDDAAFAGMVWKVDEEAVPPELHLTDLDHSCIPGKADRGAIGLVNGVPVGEIHRSHSTPAA